MNKFQRLLTASAFAVGATTGAVACDSTKPRCQAVNELVKVLQYEQGIAQAQANCEQSAKSMRPEVLNRSRPGMMKGLKSDSPHWPVVQEAFEQYVEDACGGLEIQGLILEGYRISWDTRAPGDELGVVLETARKSGMDGVKEKAALVSADVNRVIGSLLLQMSSAAENQYGNKLAGIATGKALELLGSCPPSSSSKLSAEPTLTWPTRKAF